MEQNARWIETLAEHALASSQVDQSLYAKYEVKRGLRDINGKGVLAGLTKIGEVQAHPEGRPDGPGHLIYRGMDIQDLVAGFWKEGRCGYEEIVHLLLTGHLPAAAELAAFTARLDAFRELSHGFVVSILAVSSRDVMNAMARSVLALYSRDERADDISLANVMRQSLELVAVFPQLAVSSYAAAAYRHGGRSLVLRGPKAGLSTAGNFLRMLRRDEEYTPLEERLLDLALVLHAEHGGGNNSTFTTHVVTSTGTDTYSAIAAALGSLKGPRHGGANAKVLQMFDDLKRRVRDWEDERAIEDYLLALLRKEAFDRQGLIYGMGHAVYSTSDPRTGILRDRIVGQAVCYFNTELRWRFYSVNVLNQDLTFGANVFFDGGRVLKNYHTSVPSYLGTSIPFSHPDQLDKGGVERFHLAAGGGLRFILNKNFIIAVDYGRALNRQDNGKGGSLYINTGYLF